MALLCHTCGVDLSSKISYEHHSLSGKAVSYVCSDMTAILKEQATSLGVNLDDSALLSDGFVYRGCLGAYCTYKEELEKLKQKANQAISAFHTVLTRHESIKLIMWLLKNVNHLCRDSCKITTQCYRGRQRQPEGSMSLHSFSQLCKT